MKVERQSMNQRALTRLYDAMVAAGEVKEFANGKSLSDFRNQATLQAAILRQLDVVARALADAAEYEPIIRDLLPRMDSVADLRYVLVPHYYELNLGEIWSVASGVVPPYCGQIRNILNTYGDIPI